MSPVVIARHLMICFLALSLVGCAASSRKKRGCPTPDANLGAERVLAGEGGKKPSKFKIKGMDKAYQY